MKTRKRENTSDNTVQKLVKTRDWQKQEDDADYSGRGTLTGRKITKKK
jgi:hypothetical protein